MINFKAALPLKAAPTAFLEGQRIYLKPPVLADYNEWKEVRTRNQGFLIPYEPQWAPDCLSKSFFMRRLKRQADEVKNGRGAFFLIHEKQSGKIIGGINMNDIRYGAQRCATLGYWLDKKRQGHGYMREAGQLVIDYAFQTLNLKRLNAACLLDNERSVKLLCALGFEEEGIAKKYLQINGYWQDHRLFGLTG